MHGIFYVDGNGHMFFQQSEDIPKAPTKHLFHILMIYMEKELADSYHWFIPFKLNKRMEDLEMDYYKWVKPEI